MPVTDKNILNRLYFIAGAMFLFAIAIVVQLANIQFVEGDKYKEMALEQTFRNATIAPSRGNVYADDGSLLATSVPKYDIYFDTKTVKSNVFTDKNVKSLSDSLATMFGKSSGHYEKMLKTARKNKNQYLRIARKLSYSEYIRIKKFPIFKLGANKGGFIDKVKTVREHPIGRIAERTVGYERKDDKGYYTRVGLEGAFGEYLRGKAGRRLEQKIAKGQWKPVSGDNELEPQDGFDIISTVNVNIQDIAHHALLEQLEKYKADHGCVVVMEVATGEIKAISNLGRNKKGKYYERLNYAVGESHEPGSTFKLMAIVAALEDKVIDSSYVVDTGDGKLTYYGKTVRDSNNRGYGKISASEAFEVSSNTGIVKIIQDFYGKNPEKFVDRLYNMGLNKKLDLPITGEGVPIIPHPNDKGWSGISLPWMAFGYGVSLTPLQTLTFYNAIANDGEMVRPRFVKAVRENWYASEKVFEKEVIIPSICSKETVEKVKKMMQNVVEKKHGTGNSLYSPDFSMAGKTGTCQKNYIIKENKEYISTFSGFFPVENPKYSCIVVIHEPDRTIGYYGADVSGPVFKKIAHKIYTDTPIFDEVESIHSVSGTVSTDYEKYREKSIKYKTIVPDVIGMPAMDAIPLLENLGLDVEISGSGKVTKQSLEAGKKIGSQKKIVLDLS
ncbi:transpeptidase family protein [Kordia sp. YSTF-M3]|uniref:Transpeptidase family protein n=1 Tax=Kordia aestuariivivens TaxID=2759037 RepID=A0ABR7Q441_9FLAO|nr:penicillin-binding protein [Kordia aestuariivivens]MBC8753325.1 transpeptidase family protein [Kordia aestuariivivens]